MFIVRGSPDRRVGFDRVDGDGQVMTKYFPAGNCGVGSVCTDRGGVCAAMRDARASYEISKLFESIL